MAVVIWRDSVAMGDDVDAPHERTVRARDDATIGAVLDALLRTSYLARVAGGQATWIVEGERPVAVVAQQWAMPRWLVSPERTVPEVRRAAGPPDFTVRYWRQVDPERVYACLQAGAPPPLPNASGR